MENTPLVSIIIPCYNSEATLRKAVESILRQTYTNVEVWVIDDGSQDGTRQIMNEISDSRIKRAYFDVNTKKIGAVNDVLKKVRGDYIGFQDSDDWSDPNRIELQVQMFRNDPDLGICFTAFRYTGLKEFGPSKIAITDRQLKESFLGFGNKKNPDFEMPACATMLVTKEAVVNTSGYHPYFAGRIAEDIHWVYRILKNYKGITINRPLYNYTLREGSLTSISEARINAKKLYSFRILSKIIYKDIHESIDVLSPENGELLKRLELEACEEALAAQTDNLNQTIENYKNSASYRLGRFILTPWRLLTMLPKRKDQFGHD